jgi:hypothetical protein
MNCKPGDLAVIVGFNAQHPHLTGRIVDVIEAPPLGKMFKLPDGKAHSAVQADVPCWVIRFHNGVDLSGLRGRPNALYGVCPDRALRPIRDPGEDATDETLQRLPAPSRDEVMA